MTRIHLGMDVGAGRHDRTAIVAVEHIKRPQDDTLTGRTEIESNVIWAYRFPPATTLEEVTSRLSDLIDQAPANPVLFQDATGIGQALVQQIDRAIKRGELPLRRSRYHPFTLTGGHTASGSSIPKGVLIARLVARYSTGQLGFAHDLPDMEALVKELIAFTPTVNAEGRVSYGNAPTLAEHDDLVIALALALYQPEYGDTPRFRDHRGTLWNSQADAQALFGQMASSPGTFHVTRDTSRRGY